MSKSLVWSLPLVEQDITVFGTTLGSEWPLDSAEFVHAHLHKHFCRGTPLSQIHLLGE